MLLLCCIILSIPEPSMIFFMSYDHVICDCDIYDYHTLLSKFKIKKSENQNQK